MRLDHSQFTTCGGLQVKRQVESCDGAARLAEISRQLDSQPGAVLRCAVDYPGRYQRKVLAFVNPPIRIQARDQQLLFTALNGRGQILLPEVHRALLADPLLQITISSLDRLQVHVNTGVNDRPLTEEQRTRRPGLMSALRAVLSHFACQHDKYLGLYGAFAYDLAFQFEAIQLRMPRLASQQDLVLYLPDEILVLGADEVQGQLLRYDFICKDSQGNLQTTGGLRRECPGVVQTAHLMTTVPPVTPTSDHTPEEFVDIVKKAHQHFARGDLFEVVPGQSFTTPLRDKPSAIFARLYRDNPSPYMALINLGSGGHLVSASPEMYVRVSGQRVETCPISGTIARGGNAMEDAEQIRALLNSAKDEAELSMCTDVDRNDKSRICVPGSVRLIGRRQVELYSRLIHTVDHVEGQLLPHFDALDAFLSHTWAVTVTGAPKLAAMQFIEDHEKSPRQWYGGAFGRLSFDGNMDTGLTLRTIHIRDGMATVRAGATLLHDSDPAAEEAETRLKASALLRALRPGSDSTASHAAIACLSSQPSLRALMVDHQDSFVHTLASSFRIQGVQVETLRPDQAREALASEGYDLVILSPGPGRPSDFDCSATLALCEQLSVPVFGVCLGLQAMVEYAGGRLGVLPQPVHGKASQIRHDGDPLFSGLDGAFRAGRYHSLFAAIVPEVLQVTAVTADEATTVMAVRHQHLPWLAVQFHPESILSQQTQHAGVTAGDRLIRNVVEVALQYRRQARLNSGAVTQAGVTQAGVTQAKAVGL